MQEEYQDHQKFIEKIAATEKSPPLELLQLEWQKYIPFLEDCREKITSLTSGKMEYFSYIQKIEEIYFYGGCFLDRNNIYVQFEPAKWNKKKEYKFWLQHLFLCNFLTSKEPQSYWIGKDKNNDKLVKKLNFVPNAREHLAINVEVYKEGFTRPLPLHSELFDNYPPKRKKQ